MENNEVLRKLPKIDQVLNDQRLVAVFEEAPREVVVDAVRKTVDAMRKEILAGKETDTENLFERVEKLVKKTGTKSLRRVINATGVIIHTNLGRSVLPESACNNAKFVSTGYSSLEYNLKKGTRGSRHDHLEPLIKRITGAEAAMVVNNNAAATLLCLAAISGEKETIVSRGELVEIGGSFRIPDIMEISRARLVEVGTTNKTKIDDYKKALNRDSAMILKVHKSNYA
ncbi:MAG TPA: L-seryl-tRNA(Sec) selenium transferase, partial [Bacillota bacterium]|nr:L-seryl-tRNA(Sec) selenium transferase [Bacillota bacterium]